ncbi:putative E3 ubiquitin-protein ligase UNKL isoform X4 [Pipistrellus kuhlii]|uniref:putative E3 ubiquitin-protein ligase UNKL isoform X4 n=1 Tax=Pipistrellus kuhlii TaxID=59472 RepID=UPI001E2747B5|nr:putative E3 ubiquitin-protein ligase UNKL isoform X4 [Pipistrellus kuhlii]
MPSVSKAAAAALSGSPPQTEKPTHYRYLKEFRTEQCALFVQHKCAQHRPFTCFHWHFLNQRRRRPLRRRDGTFNYSPDVYCSKYDEASGVCPDGDECPYLHRTTGDTERKYHLRYYKTGTCIHETDARGHCVKNGLHCAFAHGPLDLRPPVCDIRHQLRAGQLQDRAVPEASAPLSPGLRLPPLPQQQGPAAEPPEVPVQIYKSTKCNDMRQTGYCPRGPFCAFAHVEKNLGMANDWGCRDLMPTSSSAASSCPPGNAKWRDSPAEGSQKASEHDSKQNHLAVFTVVHPLAPSVSSSMASSLASSAGSSGSSPTALPILSARAHPLDPTGSALEAIPGSALDLHLSDVSLAPLDKELDEQDGSDLGPTGQRSLGGSEPVTIPGCLARSPSLQSSSSLSTSPLSSLSQSLSGPLVSSAMTPPQQPPPLKSEPRVLGSSASSYNSLGLNGVPGSIWDFVSGSFSPSPSPILNAGPTSTASASPNGAELARVRRQLDEAKRKIRQWEESWQQVKQACDAWQREAKEAKERALAADGARQLALQKKEEVEAQFRQLQEELEGRGMSTLPGLRGCSDIGAISLPKLQSLQSQLRLDLEAVDGVIFQLRAKQCVVCGEPARGAVLQPCQHRVLCEPCVASAPECPYCESQPLPW